MPRTEEIEDVKGSGSLEQRKLKISIFLTSPCLENAKTVKFGKFSRKVLNYAKLGWAGWSGPGCQPGLTLPGGPGGQPGWPTLAWLACLARPSLAQPG